MCFRGRAHSQFTGAKNSLHAAKCAPTEIHGADGELVQGWVHFGMLASARAIFDSVSDTVTNFLDENPDWKLLCTGHSLGGGVAALLCTMYDLPNAMQGYNTSFFVSKGADMCRYVNNHMHTRITLRRQVVVHCYGSSLLITHRSMCTRNTDVRSCSPQRY